MEDHEERRQYSRLSLCAYGVDKVCIVMHGQQRCHLDLVDISAGGARLKAKEPLPEFPGNSLQFSVHGIKDGGRLQSLAAQVRWRSGNEIGIQFDTQLDMTVTELQQLIG